MYGYRDRRNPGFHDHLVRDGSDRFLCSHILCCDCRDCEQWCCAHCDDLSRQCLHCEQLCCSRCCILRHECECEHCNCQHCDQLAELCCTPCSHCIMCCDFLKHVDYKCCELCVYCMCAPVYILAALGGK